jgi:hypothetical protein
MFCSFIDFLTEPFVFVFLLLDLHPRETIRRVYAHFRKASDGCDGSTGFGFYGFLNVRSLFLIFQALGVRERKLVDLGAGDGKVLASAMRCNARSVVGYELPSNSAHKYIYDAVFRRVFPNPIQHNQIKPMAQWLAKDIDKVFFRRVIPRLSIFQLKISIQIDVLPDDTDIVYSFWNGMPPETQTRVLELSSSCKSVRKLAVFRDDNWSKPEKGQLHFPFLSSTCVLFDTMHL